jgi:hypothetical protein
MTLTVTFTHLRLHLTSSLHSPHSLIFRPFLANGIALSSGW